MAWSESDDWRRVGGSDLREAESAFETGKNEEDYRCTRRTAFTHPSKSGLLVTCAYLPHTTLPPAVTRPSSCGGRRSFSEGEIRRPRHRPVPTYRHVHLDDGTFRDNAKLGVHRRLRVLLDTDDRELESRLEFGCGRAGGASITAAIGAYSMKSKRTVRDIGLLHTKSGRTDETLEFRRFPGKVLRSEKSV
jgi:hypothetical protein